jgi:uncharacterized protein (TIGR03067 family)
MRVRTLLAVIAVALLATEARPQNDAGRKAQPLQGEWKLVSTQDEKHTASGCGKSRMIVQTDGRVVFRLAGRTTNQGALTFGTPGKLASLDLKLADGQTLLGVYEEKGDELVICFAEAGKDRPATTAPQGAQWAEKWKRCRP